MVELTAKKDPEFTDVDEFDADGDTTHVVLTINGTAFRFDAQQVLALRGRLNGLATALNY